MAHHIPGSIYLIPIHTSPSLAGHLVSLTASRHQGWAHKGCGQVNLGKLHWSLG